ncbi:MAG: type I glyceraldehyde-3-phosphate dehydrogenase, partial [Candidatus Wildermuthbacteria bacterium]|nr:type I glyceraldehyde-3-phosphate dehydrogenase [Candidatus Wildermuthbacteria bacterium]
MTTIAINGFGRIGRLFFRGISEKPEFRVVAVNDLGSVENLEYLLKYDTVYGKFDKGLEGVKILQEKDASKLPWKELRVDIVVEATGAFESYEKAKAHLEAGARRVVITAPAKDDDGENGKTVLAGVNEEDLKGHLISSNGSCTTNSASPVVEILRENPGIKKAILNTVHGYTATQNLVDGPVRGSDVRRGRAAAQNIVPSSTGAAIAVARAVQELEGKFDGIAIRVPIVAGSIADITFVAKRKTSAQEVNEILEKAAALPRWHGIFKVTKDPIVSSDII